MTELDRSYSLCHRYARAAASNFYYSFFLLPRAKRRAMYALYAFMRRVDDVGDSAGDVSGKSRELQSLRTSLDRAVGGKYDDAMWPAIADMVRNYSIPPRYLVEVIDGVEMDVRGERFETFDELSRYCHCVAGVVGQACVHIWGFEDERSLVLAEDCGLAFQLTNILRDLAEDAGRGRVYLPEEELKRFEYSREDLLTLVRNERFERLLRFQIERAEQLYVSSAELPRYLHRDGRRVFQAMYGTYRELLEEVQRFGREVLQRRVSLTRGQKLRIWLGALLNRASSPVEENGEPHLQRSRRAAKSTVSGHPHELHR